jgi:Retrotransposon gag protein
MTDSPASLLVNNPIAWQVGELSNVGIDEKALTRVSTASGDLTVLGQGCVWEHRHSTPKPQKPSMYGDDGYMGEDTEAKLRELEKQRELEKELEQRKQELDNLKANQGCMQGNIEAIEKQLGRPSSQKIAETSVFGMPFQQLAKATFNDTSLIPSKFTGKRLGIDCLNRWIEQFNKYARFKQMDENTKYEFFKLLMVDEAADWAANLEDTVEVDFSDLFERFRERFLLTDIQKWQQARSVWQRQQKPNESVDEYITWVKNRAKNLPEIGENQLVYIIISGLKKEIRADVLKAKHDTIDEVKKIARISEIAERESNEGNTTIADLERTIAILVDKVDQKLTISPETARINVSNEQPTAYSAMGEWMIERDENRRQARREQLTPRSDSRQQFASRSPTPVQRVQWQQQNAPTNARYNPQIRQQSPFRRPQRFEQSRQSFDGRPNYRPVQRQQSPGPNRNNFGRNCGNCGLQHAQGQCPAYGNECYHCKKRGHYARSCRSARNFANSQ